MRVWIALALIGLLAGVARAEDDNKPMDDDAYVQSQLDAKLPQFERDRVTILQAAKVLSDMGHVNIYVENAALVAGGYDLEKTPVFVSAKGITVRECINRTVKSFENPKAPLRWVVESGVVILSTAADQNWAAIPEAAGKYGQTDAFKAENVIASVDFDGVRLEEAMKLLHDQGINLFVHWQALADLQIDRHNKITLQLTRVRPKTAMQLLIRRLAGPKGEVSYTIYDNVWVISTPKDLIKQLTVWGWRVQNIEDQQSANKLANVLDDVTFTGKEFGSAIEDLGRMADTTMDVNWPSVKDAGVERDTQVAFSVKQVKLSTALDLMLTEVSGTEKQLDYTAKDNTVHVSMKREPEKPATRPTAVKPKTATGVDKH